MNPNEILKYRQDVYPNQNEKQDVDVNQNQNKAMDLNIKKVGCGSESKIELQQDMNKKKQYRYVDANRTKCRPIKT